MGKTHENRYWQIEQSNGRLVGKLHFTQYYDDEVILSFAQDKNEKECYWYVSDFLKVDDDCIIVDSPEDAMQEFESMIIEHIEDEIGSFEDMLEKFNEERVN